MESNHPVFNQLLCYYSNIRGSHLKGHVMRTFLPERVHFVLETVDKMIKVTSRTKRPDTKKRGKCRERNDVLWERSEIH